jgi:hypothetical protein
MGSSAFEIVFIPVLRGMVYGIVMGMAMLALMNAVEVLFNRLGRRGRSIEAVHRATIVAPRRIHGPAVRIARPRGVYG